jgi:hypothetical protein
VLFPQPDGPTTVRTSPVSTERSTPCSATTSPSREGYDFARRVIWIFAVGDYPLHDRGRYDVSTYFETSSGRSMNPSRCIASIGPWISGALMQASGSR